MSAWTCPACRRENPEGMRFCGHCGAAAADGPRGRLANAAQLRRRSRSPSGSSRPGGELPEERRLITALFADVSGFTALADRLDPEELLEVIDPVISGLSSIVGRYEGYVEKFAGDALLALFGAPVSHEDDAERALLVALEMHRELARMCEDLPHEAELTLHCGVNSGHGIARILGSEARMDYAVLGDSVILAQRLESAAPKGETYVSDLTYRLTADRFEFEPVGELTLKGKSEAVLAWRLVGERHSDAPTRQPSAWSGESASSPTIAGVLERAQDGRGGVVVVTRRARRREVAAHRGCPRARRDERASLAADAVPVVRRRARVLAVRGPPAHGGGHPPDRLPPRMLRERSPTPWSASGSAFPTSPGSSDCRRRLTTRWRRSSPRRSAAASTRRSRRGCPQLAAERAARAGRSRTCTGRTRRASS